MTWFLLPPLGDAVTRPVFELGRVQSNADLVAPVAAALAIMVVLRMIYRADARELRPAIGWMLTGLRWLVVLALLLVYLQPQWRIEEERRINSRALVLVDGSLSMGITDETTGAATRSGQLAEALKRSRLVERLRRTHDVAVYRFGEKLEPILVGERLSGDDKSGAAAPREWPKSLAPTATQTRLGEALAEAIGRQRDVPVSGILLLTDGGQNAGVGPEAAMAVARRASIPVFPRGLRLRPAARRVADQRLRRADPCLSGRSVRGHRLLAGDGPGRPNRGSGIAARPGRSQRRYPKPNRLLKPSRDRKGAVLARRASAAGRGGRDPRSHPAGRR